MRRLSVKYRFTDVILKDKRYTDLLKIEGCRKIGEHLFEEGFIKQDLLQLEHETNQCELSVIVVKGEELAEINKILRDISVYNPNIRIEIEKIKKIISPE